MRTMFRSRLLMTLAVIPVLAAPTGANANTPAFSYRSSGTCLASPSGFQLEVGTRQFRRRVDDDIREYGQR